MDALRSAVEILGTVVLPFLVVLSLVVLAHELGHYAAARAFRLPVSRFSLGFGPRLCGVRDRSGTEWIISAVPLGGYVKVAFDRRRTARAAVIAAGPLSNLVLAAALLFAHDVTVGIRDATPVVAGVHRNSPAAQAGFREGDRILSMNGRSVLGFTEIHRYVALHLAEPVRFEIERGGGRLVLVLHPWVVDLTLASGRTERLGVTGLIAGARAVHQLDALTAAGNALRGTANLVADTLHGLKQLATGDRTYKSLAGVVGIADITGTVVRSSGLVALLAFAALISVNLAVVNALPLPILDGGQLLLVGAEAALRRPLPGQVTGYANAVGLGVLTAVLLLTTWNDVRFLV